MHNSKDRSESMWLSRKIGKPSILADKESTVICFQQKHAKLSCRKYTFAWRLKWDEWRCRMLQIALWHLPLLHMHLVFKVRVLEALDLLKVGFKTIGRWRKQNMAGEGAEQPCCHSWSWASPWSLGELWIVNKTTEFRHRGLACWKSIWKSHLRFSGISRRPGNALEQRVLHSQHSQQLGGGGTCWPGWSDSSFCTWMNTAGGTVPRYSHLCWWYSH